MVEIKPFKGFLYDTDKIGAGYEEVVSPPYDVISDRMQDVLYQKSVYNIVRLILGKSVENDDDVNNKYTRAKKVLDEWQKQGVIRQDSSESFYIYVQEYEYKNKKYRRIGFMGLMKIEDSEDNAVLPHERTLSRPKQDRMNLLSQVESNLSPIFTLFEDKTGIINKILEEGALRSKPVIDIEVDGQRHRLWHLDDKNSLEKIVSLMKDKKIFIADGHHRYEVACIYRNMRRKKTEYNGSADYILMYFTDMEQKNLTIMAAHRVIKDMPRATEEAVSDRLCRYFDISECCSLGELMKRMEIEESSNRVHVFGFFGGKKYLFMKSKDESLLLNLIKEEKNMEWKKLDVSILHFAVLKSLLGVKNTEDNITYVRDPEEAERLVLDKSHKVAFFLNPTKVEQLKAVAELGDMMPQKSTYFYPKLLTGLVINRFSPNFNQVKI